MTSPHITPAEEAAHRGDRARTRRYREQDRERAAAKAKITNDGKNPDSSPTPEALAFVELCTRQVQVNMALYDKRNRDAVQPPRRDQAKEWDQFQQSLGIVAKPMPYQDDDRVRQDARKLGLTPMTPHHVTLPGDLARDIADALELIARGGFPAPDRAAVLLQRLVTAIRMPPQSSPAPA